MNANTATTLTSAARPVVHRENLPAYATVPEWCRLSGMGKSVTYEMLGVGNLRARKLGARTLIDVPHGLAWLDSLPAAAIRPHGGKRAA